MRDHARVVDPVRRAQPGAVIEHGRRDRPLLFFDPRHPPSGVQFTSGLQQQFPRRQVENPGLKNNAVPFSGLPEDLIIPTGFQRVRIAEFRIDALFGARKMRLRSGHEKMMAAGGINTAAQWRSPHPVIEEPRKAVGVGDGLPAVDPAIGRSAAEQFFRLDQRHAGAAFGGAERRRDAAGAAAGDDDVKFPIHSVNAFS
ncbi:hypothetical protein SDC9_72453 [bioreactor metagenome]|uniref:Uncharacterized protein n=1 Tax=bioreactor metagenome TaxID=1076179 RepID=A0A644YBF8_9ZZZZ